MKDSFKQVPQTKLCRRPHGRLRKPMLTACESPKTCQRYPARMMKIPTKEMACIFCSFSDSPKKTAHSPCLLSQVVWTVRVPPRFDLAVFRDSHAGQSWMKHGPRTAPIRFDQKPGQPWSPSPSGPSSWLSENDSSCMQGINCMSHVICPRSRMPITQGDVAIRSLELPR